MADPAAQIQEGIDVVKEQTHAAGLLGQGLLEHQRHLEALLDEFNDPARRLSAEEEEQALAELQDLHEQRDKLLEQLSAALSLSKQAAPRTMPFFASAPSSASDDVDRLRHDKDEAARQVEVVKMRVADLETKHDAFKQENWDLYVAHQQLEEQLAQRVAAQNKAESERQRLASELAQIRDSVETQRIELEMKEEEVRKLQKQHETDQAVARRDRAGFRRNVSDLQGQLKRMQGTGQRGQRIVTPSAEVAPAPAPKEEAAADDASHLRHRFALDEGTGDAPAMPIANAETEELRSKLAIAVKRMGRDSQQQRRLREQLTDLKRMLASAGMHSPDDDDDDLDDGNDDEAWITEAISAAPPKPRPLRRRGAKRIVSRELSVPSVPEVPENADWIDDDLGDESVIIRDHPLDPGLFGSHVSLADQAGLRSLTKRSPSGVINTGALGAELDAEGYTAQPEMVDVGIMTEGDIVQEALEKAHQEHAQALAELEQKYKAEHERTVGQHAAVLASLEQQHTSRLQAALSERDEAHGTRQKEAQDTHTAALAKLQSCLLYTSDAADE